MATPYPTSLFPFEIKLRFSATVETVLPFLTVVILLFEGLQVLATHYQGPKGGLPPINKIEGSPNDGPTVDRRLVR
jgi:hypothetical protein